MKHYDTVSCWLSRRDHRLCRGVLKNLSDRQRRTTGRQVGGICPESSTVGILKKVWHKSSVLKTEVMAVVTSGWGARKGKVKVLEIFLALCQKDLLESFDSVSWWKEFLVSRKIGLSQFHANIKVMISWAVFESSYPSKSSCPGWCSLCSLLKCFVLHLSAVCRDVHKADEWPWVPARF